MKDRSSNSFSKTGALASRSTSESGGQDSHSFVKRHIGPSPKETEKILKTLNVSSLEDLAQQILPEDVNRKERFQLPPPLSESALLKEACAKASKNKIEKSYIGQAYKSAVVPLAIQKNVWENPVWFSSYTPYQAELAQGRLEALLNFQTMTMDLTGMELANASLLDEGSALAEALVLAKNAGEGAQAESQSFFVDSRLFPQNLEVLKTRSRAFGWEMLTGRWEDFSQAQDCFAVVLQYPDATGELSDIEPFLRKSRKAGCLSVVAADLLSLTLLKPPGEMGADVVVGSSQNFGLPLFFGGPHAAFFATHKKFIRHIPGRLVGVSKDRHGKTAYRLSLQTREQHIRRERASSNICTAQALPAVSASFYAVYHGPEGLKRIALKIHNRSKQLACVLKSFKDLKILNRCFFDTLTVKLSSSAQAFHIYEAFQKQGINLGRPGAGLLSFTLDETTEETHILQIEGLFASLLGPAKNSFLPEAGSPAEAERKQQAAQDTSLAKAGFPANAEREPVTKAQKLSFSQETRNAPQSPAKESRLAQLMKSALKSSVLPDRLLRTSPYLTHPVFNSHHSEAGLIRYIHSLAEKELSLAHSMIPLGSCTMKLNSAVELAPLAFPAFTDLHPFAPIEQAEGFLEMICELEAMLCELTGFSAFSFQPNAGSQGEYAGLLAVRKYHEARGEAHRKICLIPSSAHGTNPASAVMAGLKAVSVRCDKEGGIDREDIEQKLDTFGKNLAGAMITYPSTYGFFEEGIKELCQKIHNRGGLVYWDGANMNALLGLCKPAGIGFDLGHLNLHKTFCIPHGGGGPGVGPLGVSAKLKPFLPGHVDFSGQNFLGQKKSDGRRHSASQNKGAFFASSKGKAGPAGLTGRQAFVAGEVSPQGDGTGAVSSAPYGNAGILPVSWAYIKLTGLEGLRLCSMTALANANYIAERLKTHYRILFKGKSGRTAHECIIDLRKFRFSANITVDDIAKRLMDYSFHAPTVSWPAPGSMMIEPTESENKKELDRFCEALISIRGEIAQAETDTAQKALLKNAPHSIEDLLKETWPFPYSKQQAFFPLPWVKERKFFPPVSRIDNAYGDIQPFCSCPPVFEEA